MKTTISHTALLGLTSLALSATIATAQPPPIGPPLNRTEEASLSVSVLTSVVRGMAQKTVDETNADLRAEDKSARVSIEELRVFSPQRTQTQTPNRPNSFLVRVPHFLTIKVDIPATFDRHITIPLDVDVFCDNWQERGGGSITVRARPGPAAIEGGSILEDILQVRSFIEAEVRSSFTPPLPVTLPLPGRCLTLGASDLGTPQVEDDSVVWDEPKAGPGTGLTGSVAAVGQLQPTIEVTFERLKRLRARRFPGNTVLYEEVERILLHTFANYTEAGKSLTMREDDDVALNLPTIRLPARTFDTLVVIGDVQQPPDNPKDSAFAAAARAQSYRPGRHVLRIPKTFSTPPNAQNPKPQFFTVPAYELTYTVKFIEPVISPSN